MLLSYRAATLKETLIFLDLCSPKALFGPFWVVFWGRNPGCADVQRSLATFLETRCLFHFNHHQLLLALINLSPQD
jgi:hypothetical protein